MTLFLSWREADALADAIRQQRQDEQAEWQKGMREWLAYWRSLVDAGRKSMAWMCAQIDRGEPPDVPGPRPVPQEPTDDPVVDLGLELETMLWEAVEALARVAAQQRQAAAAGVPQAVAFVTIARRLHSLLTRALSAMDGLEREVDDPDLMTGMFEVDHFITLIRRQVESIAVLGGEVPRSILTPVELATVLRQAVAEIEQYPRVRVYPPPVAAVPGHAAANVIHLLAELAENATKFSPHHTQVILRASLVSAGLAIEVEDRGLRIPAERLERLNQLLAAPDTVDVPSQLRDGRIGLLVAARIAQRYGIRVELRVNIFGGTQALVVLPAGLVTRPAEVPSSPTPPAVAPIPRSAAAPMADEPWSAAAVPGHPAPAEPSPRHAAAELPPPPPSADRPALPRRSPTQLEATRHPDPAPGPEAPSAKPGFMADYMQGVRRSHTEQAHDQTG